MAYHVPYMLLADRVEETPDGKFSVVGIFDRVRTGQLPAQHRQFFLFAFVYTDSADGLGEHDVTFSLQPPRASEPPPPAVTGQLTLTEGSGLWAIGGVRVIAEFVGTPFHEEGVHWLLLQIDGQEVARVPLTVAVAPAVPAEQAR